MYTSAALIVALAGTAMAGTVLWDGRLNNMTAASELAELNEWSFSDEVGQYQYYIHGTGNASEYVNLAADYKNPADSSSNLGIKITIDNSSVWNNDGMLRTELIPDTSAPINAGKVFYHFSMQHTGVNVPSDEFEHQVCFFESHFTEMKYGLIDGESGTTDTHLRWEVSSDSKWNVTFTAGVWHNIAYAIDFDADTVAFYHSTGSDDLALTAGPFSATTTSNGADWHLGVLRLPSTTGVTNTAAEDWYFSGVYIESDTLTTTVSGPASDGSTSSDTTTSAASSSTAAATSASSSAAASSSVAATIVASSSAAATTTAVASSTVSTSSASSVKASSASSSSSISKASMIIPATTASSSSSTAPTTMATSVKSSSSFSSSKVATTSSAAASTTSLSVHVSSSAATTAVATVATSAAAASASSSASGDSCAVEYVYVDA